MDDNTLHRFAPRFRACDLAARPKQAPKLGLPLLKAARQYRESLDAADSFRRDLIAAALNRSGDPETALAALNHLADCFQIPPFTEDDLAGA